MNNIDEILENLTMNQKKEVPELNDLEKQRVLNRATDKINQKNATRHIRFGRTALICAVCAAFITSVAAAAGYFRLDEMFYKYLHGSDTSVEVAGEDITAQDTSNGITVTAKQVIGDDYGFYVIFDVAEKDNIIKRVAVNEAEVEIKGADVYQCSDIIGMQGENPNTFMLHIMSCENLQGKEIAVRLKNTGTSKIKDNKSYGLALGNSEWNLNWKINYSNSAKSFDVSKPIGIYGGTALWESVSISPVSVSVKMTDLSGIKPHCGILDDIITVTMKDGSVFSSDNSEDTDILSDTDFITMSFNRIIDINKIESVSFAGEIYKIN